MVRLFAALALPPWVAEALLPRQNGIAGALWRSTESLHVTLRFFGEVREDTARDLDEQLAEIIGKPFEIALKGAGAFGEAAELQAVWAGVSESPELRRLAKACEAAARRAGLAPDRRHYRPHVTLAYLKRPDPAEAAHWIQANNLLQSPPIPVTAFALFSSVLTRKGSHYRAEAEYPLG